jgi:hypothetical protein
MRETTAPLPIEEIKEYFQDKEITFLIDYENSKIAEKINSFDATAIGNTAPDFSATSPDGKIISLKQSLCKTDPSTLKELKNLKDKLLFYYLDKQPYYLQSFA